MRALWEDKSLTSLADWPCEESSVDLGFGGVTQFSKRAVCRNLRTEVSKRQYTYIW